MGQRRSHRSSFPASRRDYHVSGQQMAWMNGPRRSPPQPPQARSLPLSFQPASRASVGYLSVCLFNEALLLILWLGPLSPSTYFIGATLYLFTIGACYAFIHRPSCSSSSVNPVEVGCGRYSIINSLGNVPVVYMTALDGRGGKLWGRARPRRHRRRLRSHRRHNSTHLLPYSQNVSKPQSQR